MKRGQLGILALAALAIALVAVIAGGGSDDGGGGGGDSTTARGGDAATGDAVTVSFAYSLEKEVLLKPLIERFNSSGAAVDGRPVRVAPQVIASGEAETKIAAGRLKPVAWSPASSLWGRLLAFEADRPLVPDDAPSLVRTPLVIAMWEPMAQALGYPRKPVGWADILRLARSRAGWADYDRPEFGRFKLVHTNPDFSTSGLEAVVAEYYAATGKKEGLRSSDVTGKARASVRAIERSIVHYGDTTSFVSQQMRARGPAYASAVAMEEATLLDFNRNRGSQPKLIAIYPEEGTFFSDNPFIVLNGDWVDAAERKGAETFRRYLAEQLTPAVAARGGFRPADLRAKPVAPVTAENGVDPAQPRRVLGVPQPRVLAQLKRAWREDRKPANVLLVVDTSTSMEEEDRLERAKVGLRAFLAQVEPQDRIGLTIFSDQIQRLAPIGSDRAQLRATVDRLIPDGGTALYDAAVDGYQTVRQAATGDDRINAVVLLTDGEDVDSVRGLEQAEQELSRQSDSATQVRVFTIAYSPGAVGAKDALERLAAASGGKSYQGTTEDIEAVYRSISSFF